MDYITHLINTQKSEFDHFCDELNVNTISQLSNLIYSNRTRNIFIIGVGKNGIVAQLVAQLFNSINYKLIFQDSNQLLHGNLGIIDNNSLVIMLTKSGNTIELVNICQHLHKRDCHIVCINMNHDGFLKQYVTEYLVIPSVTELDEKLEKVPTLSVLSFIAFFNIVISYIIDIDDSVTRIKYGANHPSGDIGMSLSLSAKDVITYPHDCVVCLSTCNTIDAISLMNEKRENAIVVVNNDNVVQGIVTDFDIRNSLISGALTHIHTSTTQISKCMTSNPVCCTIDTSVKDIINLFKQNDMKYFSGIIVVDNDDDLHLVGVVHGKDIVRFL